MVRSTFLIVITMLTLTACGRLDTQPSENLQEPVSIHENTNSAKVSSPEELCEAASMHMQNCFQLDAPVKGINLSCDAEMAEWITEASCDELHGVTPMHGWYGFFDWFEQSACNLGWAYYCTPEGCAQDEPLDSCSEYESFDDCQMCEMYSCLESEKALDCGERGYFRGYGKKYCERFSAITGEFMSDAGRVWLANVRSCLLSEVERIIEKTSACSGIRQEAFDSHPQCYIDSGLCSLPPGDWAHIVATISPWDNDLKQVILSGAGCMQEWLNN